MCDIQLTDEYWDCECKKDYIHLRSQKLCPVCTKTHEDQPNSRVPEVIEHGFVFLGEETETIKFKKMALVWMKNNINVNERLEDRWTRLSDVCNLSIYTDKSGNKKTIVFWRSESEPNLAFFSEIL